MKAKRQRVKTKWTKAGRLKGRPAGSRSYDDETSRSADPIVRKGERRGRPVVVNVGLLHIIQAECGIKQDGYAKMIAEASATEPKVATVKRQLRRTRSQIRLRQVRRRYSKWNFD